MAAQKCEYTVSNENDAEKLELVGTGLDNSAETLEASSFKVSINWTFSAAAITIYNQYRWHLGFQAAGQALLHLF